MSKKKIYAVAVGRKTGIFHSWDEVKGYVDGFKGAVYKSFGSSEEASRWLQNPSYSSSGDKKTVKTAPPEFGSDTIVIYSDGGSINNPGPGGYGAVVIEGEKIQELSQGFRHTTNNRMELLGVISALEFVGKTEKQIRVFTDSKYVVNGISKGWAKSWRSNGWRKSNNEPALNSDLWERLLQLTAHINVDFNWVKGHAGDFYNERCDELAVMSANSKNQKIDSFFENNC